MTRTVRGVLRFHSASRAHHDVWVPDASMTSTDVAPPHGSPHQVSMPENPSDATLDPVDAMTSNGTKKRHLRASIFSTFGAFVGSSRHHTGATPSGATSMEAKPSGASSIVAELVRGAQELTEEQVAEFKECFSLFDVDGSGTVDTSELGEVMRSLGQTASDDELQRMIGEVDADRSGTVDFAEFLGMMAKQMRDHDTNIVLQRAFDLFSAKDDGQNRAAAVVPVDVLDVVFAALCDGAGPEEIRTLTREAAGDGTTVTFTQFMSLFDNERERERENPR